MGGMGEMNMMGICMGMGSGISCYSMDCIEDLLERYCCSVSGKESE